MNQSLIPIRLYMKIMWCWRCQRDVPMLNEDEYRLIDDCYCKCMQSVKDYRERHNVTLAEMDIDGHYQPLRDLYAEITGDESVYHHEEIRHHRISSYGDPCPNCGKPFRTPQAKLCAVCGFEKMIHES